MNRITLTLSQEEREALYRASMADVRPMRDQARWLILDALQRRGLLPSPQEPVQQNGYREGDNGQSV